MNEEDAMSEAGSDPTAKAAGSKRPYVNASFGELEELVDRGMTREELEAVAVELSHRKPRPKVLALLARVAELVEAAEAGG